MKIAIVGGGITGLTLAYRLSAQGQWVSVFEKNKEWGGLAGSFPVQNTSLEKYYHHIFSSDQEIVNLISDLGLQNHLFWKKAPMGYYTSNRIFPFNTPWDLLNFSALPWKDRIRLGLWLKKIQNQGWDERLDKKTVQEWVTETASPEIFERFWLPLLRSKFGCYAEKTSAAWLWGRVLARIRSRSKGRETLGYLQGGGFSLLIQKLVEAIQVQGGKVYPKVEIKNIRFTSKEKWSLHPNPEDQDFDRVVLTLPCPSILSLCPFLSEPEKTKFSSISYQGVVCLTLLLENPLGPIYWLNLSDPSIPFAGLIEHTNLIPPQHYQGHSILYVFNYLPFQHPWFSLSAEKLFSLYEPGLRQIFPSFQKKQIRATFLFRDPFATPVYEVNYFQKKPPLVSDQKGLFFANTSHVFPWDRNMNSSLQLVETLLPHLLGGINHGR